ncbi:hypothetical protein [Brasilonema bromeliae]|nr:hypothetical protein [Brasilonema bromeliae]
MLKSWERFIPKLSTSPFGYTNTTWHSSKADRARVTQRYAPT